MKVSKKTKTSQKILREVVSVAVASVLAVFVFVVLNFV